MVGNDEVPHERPVTVWVGKGGVSAAVAETESQLNARSFVKVRFHRSALDRESVAELASTLADASGATVVDVRGRTAVLQPCQ